MFDMGELEALLREMVREVVARSSKPSFSWSGKRSFGKTGDARTAPTPAHWRHPLAR